MDPDNDVELVGRIPAVPTILDVVSQVTGMRFSAIARVTGARWVACHVRDCAGLGLQSGSELPLETTICREIRDHRQPVIISDVVGDALYRLHPTPALYGFKSYISVPIVLPDDSFFGTLCALDPDPRDLEAPQVLGMFRLFADLVAFHLDSERKLVESEAALARERELADLREQFVAVLGHDLRNPLMAVEMGTTALLRHPERAPEIVARMKQSVLRMSGLIDNVLDLARTRLGDGLVMDCEAGEPLEPALGHVVHELRSIYPDRRIDTEFRFEQPVRCDRPRIAQLLSNLLANALTHGASDSPVTVTAVSAAGGFRLSVANRGSPIPEEAMQKLFLPFVRGAASSGRDGLGLGLYIAAEIARAHGGCIDVESTPSQTTFTLRMPNQRQAGPIHTEQERMAGD